MADQKQLSLAEQIEVVNAKVAGLAGAVKRSARQKDDYRKQVSDLTSANEKLNDGLGQLKSDYSGLLGALEEVKVKLESTLKERDDLKAQLQQIGEAAGVSDKAAELELKLSEVTMENQDLIKEMEMLKADYIDIQKQHEELIGNNDMEGREAEIILPNGDIELEGKEGDGDYAALKVKYDALLIEHEALKQEKDLQDELFEDFQRQTALGKNIKTILNKRIDSTIAQLEDMLERQQ